MNTNATHHAEQQRDNWYVLNLDLQPPESDPFPYVGEHGSRHAHPGTLNGKPLVFAPREEHGGAA